MPQPEIRQMRRWYAHCEYPCNRKAQAHSVPEFLRGSRDLSRLRCEREGADVPLALASADILLTFLRVQEDDSSPLHR